MLQLNSDIAERFALIALGHVTREYPSKLDHMMYSASDARTPRDLHPIFFGSFDWHSCVHGYWMLARLARLYPDMGPASAIAARFEESFTPEAIDAELSYLEQPSSRSFERPYGWAWALMLAAELRLWNPTLAEAFDGIEQNIVLRFHAYLPMLTYAVRTGVHSSTAFALILASEYAAVAKDTSLRDLLSTRARHWYGNDRAAQAWEPGGDEFLSPTLCEAEAMRRLLPRAEFLSWFDAFLPELARGKPETLFIPAHVSDRSDGKTAHLDGVNLSRAWCMRALASSLPDKGCRDLLRRAAEAHVQAAMPHVAGDYMGEHWLASFATLALTT
ncbi:hypothetical protein FHS83_001709 [Rhizomicrobium palustre]|uniref:DUF2891 domain-containing protein n=1 Tax=Rhizomicrobium palustre TaxID=189966 RepID=A0A846MZ69_9PROT|nr:DUF2891 domain-containing protein [Rhizomicrobium palustre]NIK88391.1 hypothetical protein [Rhizomicrobium palustre]